MAKRGLNLVFHAYLILSYRRTRSNSMAFVTSQLETLGMIEQPVWLWYGDWNEQINNIQYNYIGENKKSDSCLATHENSRSFILRLLCHTIQPGRRIIWRPITRKIRVVQKNVIEEKLLEIKRSIRRGIYLFQISRFVLGFSFNNYQPA